MLNSHVSTSPETIAKPGNSTMNTTNEIVRNEGGLERNDKYTYK
jgi:hypothetical protein